MSGVPTKGVIRSSETVSELSLGPLGVRVLATGGDTGGRFGLVDTSLSPGVLAGPLHTHRHEDGYWFVLDGEFGALVGEEVVRAGPGVLIMAPRGIPHTYWNPGTRPARYLELFSPAGLESYFLKLAELVPLQGDVNIAQVVALSSDFGLDLDLGSIPELIQRFGVAIPGF